MLIVLTYLLTDVIMTLGVIFMKYDKSKTCCFTGHREVNPDHLSIIKTKLKTIIIDLIERGYVLFCTGGALGFDTLVARSILNLKKDYPFIKLALVLPCVNQATQWNEIDRMEYENIKEKADEVVYTSTYYYRGCMHKRNRYLVDNSSACICYMLKDKGGTAYTVQYAKKRSLLIYNVMKGGSL